MGPLAKNLIFLLWIFSVVLVSYAIWLQDSFFKKNEESIASINILKSSASVRSEGVIRWRDAVSNQKLFDGDWIYIPPEGKAKLTMVSGQVVELGEDTQIQVRSTMQENKQNTYLLSLVKGSLIADTKRGCQNCSGITIQSESKSVKVKSGESIVLKKEVGKAIVKLADEAPLPTFEGKKTAAMGVLEQAFEVAIQKTAPVVDPVIVSSLKAEELLPLPLPAPIPSGSPPELESPPIELKRPDGIDFTKITLKIKSLVAKIQADATRKIVYTTDYKVRDLKREKIIIKMVMPSNDAIENKMVPALQVSSGAKKYYEQGFPGSSEVTISLENLFANVVPKRTGFIRDYEVTLLPGILLSGKKPSAEDFKGVEVILTIRVLGEIMGPELLVFLDTDRLDSNFANPWVNPKKIVKREDKEFGFLIPANEFGKLRPYLRGSSRIGVFPASAANEGIFLLKNKKFLGEIIEGSQGNLDDYVRLAISLFGVDLIYRGTKNSYYKEPLAHDNQVGINKILDEGKTLYVLKKGKIYPISREFVKSNQDVAYFIDSQSRAIFVDKVVVLHSL